MGQLRMDFRLLYLLALGEMQSLLELTLLAEIETFDRSVVAHHSSINDALCSLVVL